MYNKGPVLAILLASTVATAQAEGLYIQAGLGGADYDLQNQALIDSRAFMFNLGLGYQFSDTISIEGSYVNLGTLDSLDPDPASADTTVWDLTTSGLDLSLVGHVAIDDELTVFAKVGNLFWESTLQRRVSNGGLTYMSDGSSLAIGGGIEFNNVLFEYKHYKLGDTDVNTFQLGYKIRL